MDSNRSTPLLASAAYFAGQKILNYFLLLQNTKSGGSESEGAAEGGCGGEFRRARASEFSIWIFVKKSSNFVQKTPPSFTFSEIERGCLGASRLGMVFFRNFEGIFEIQKQSAVGNAEVPVRSTKKTKFSEPIFFLSPLAKGTAIFSLIAQKQTIWTT